MTTMTANVIRAKPEDAALLAALGHATFVETFGHMYPPEDLAPFLAHTYTPAMFRRFLDDPAQALWIARADGQAVGYVQAGACALPHPDVTPTCGEVKRLYVKQGTQNGGIGSALLDTALTWLERPARALWIGVWSENRGAQRLYERRGFVKVGAYEFPVGNTRDHEFILRRA